MDDCNLLCPRKGLRGAQGTLTRRGEVQSRGCLTPPVSIKPGSLTTFCLDIGRGVRATGEWGEEMDFREFSHLGNKVRNTAAAAQEVSGGLILDKNKSLFFFFSSYLRYFCAVQCAVCSDQCAVCSLLSVVFHSDHPIV